MEKVIFLDDANAILSKMREDSGDHAMAGTIEGCRLVLLSLVKEVDCKSPKDKSM